MTANNPRILIVTHCFPSYTADIPGNFLVDFTAHLSDLGAKVTVLTQKMTGKTDEKFLSQSKAVIEYFDWKGGDKRFAEMKISSLKDLISLFSLIANGRKKFKQLTRSNDYDFVLSCWVISAGLWTFTLKKNFNSAVWALGSDIGVYGKKAIFKPVLKAILAKTGTIFTNSFSLQKEIFKLFNFESKILYTGRILPRSALKYERSDIFRLVFIGRIENVKGPDLLISALINSKLNNFSLKIIGEGTMRDQLESIVRKNNMQNNIEFVGMKNGSEIADYLKTSDYLVISSRSESMPVVFWEAMQSSTPVLSTKAGDIEYYCERFNVGRVCEPDERSLAELLVFAQDFKPLRELLSENTKKVCSFSSIISSAESVFEIAKRTADEKH